MKRLFILITLTSAFFVGCGQGYVNGTMIPINGVVTIGDESVSPDGDYFGLRPHNSS